MMRLLCLRSDLLNNAKFFLNWKIKIPFFIYCSVTTDTHYVPPVKHECKTDVLHADRSWEILGAQLWKKLQNHLNFRADTSHWDALRYSHITANSSMKHCATLDPIIARMLDQSVRLQETYLFWLPISEMIIKQICTRDVHLIIVMSSPTPVKLKTPPGCLRLVNLCYQYFQSSIISSSLFVSLIFHVLGLMIQQTCL